MKRYKLTLILPYFCYPPDSGGKVLIYNHLRLLAEYFDVTVLVPFHSKMLAEDEKGLEKIKDSFSIVPIDVDYQNPFRHGFLSCLRYTAAFILSFFKKYPVYGIKEFYSHPEVVKYLKMSDLVQLEHSWWYHPLLRKRKGALVLIEHNFEVEYWNQTAFASLIQRRFRKAIEEKVLAWKLQRQEKEALEDADLVVTVSNRDKECIKKFFSMADNKFISEHGINIDFYKEWLQMNSGKEQKETIDLIYAGSLYLSQTAEGGIWLIKNVLPILRKSQHKFRFILVGRNPIAPLKRIAQLEKDIILTGFVEDIRPQIHDADIYVVPLRRGSGVRFKIMEAMAMGKPIVSTSKGIEGLDINNCDIVIADTAYDFAQAIISWADKRGNISEKNMDYADRYFNIQKNFESKTLLRYHEILKNHLENKK